MDDYGLDVARASLLEHIGRYAEAAEIHLAENNTLEAIRLLMLDRNNETSLKRAFTCVLDGLWQHLSCGVGMTEEMRATTSTVTKLLQLTDGMEDANVDENLRDEVRFSTD